MRKLICAIVPVGLLVLTGCSVVSVKTPSGYAIRYARVGIIPRQYVIRDFEAVSSNVTVRIGCAVSNVDTNGATALNNMAKEVTGAAVSAAVKAAK